MAKDTQYYLSIGMDLAAAEYFAAGRRRIISVAPNDDFTLTLQFDNSEKRLLDCKPMLKKNTVFEHFMDYSDFRRVYLDEDNCVSWDIDPNIDSNVVWSNKVDLCPDSCYIDSVPIEQG